MLASCVHAQRCCASSVLGFVLQGCSVPPCLLYAHLPAPDNLFDMLGVQQQSRYHAALTGLATASAVIYSPMYGYGHWSQAIFLQLHMPGMTF